MSLAFAYTEVVPPSTPVIERIALHVRKRGPHLIWQGSTNAYGNAIIRSGGRDGPMLSVHRVLYEARHGELPASYLYKTCYIKNCVACWAPRLVPGVAERNRRKHLRDKYQISIEEYEAMLRKQRGKCAACGTTEPGGRWEIFHVDHNHETGEICGLLCNDCNCAGGFLKDNPERASKLARYLRRTR